MSRYLGIVGVAGLSLLAIAYATTSEPAPRIRVLWRDGVTLQQQTAVTRQYFLVNGRDRFPNGSTAYDLLDTSRSNIRALVQDPHVADTGDLDRDAYVVRDGTDSGHARTWIAYRIPGLRQPWARQVVMLILVLAALAGLRRAIAAAVRETGVAIRPLIRVLNAHRHNPAESRDVFDVIPGAESSAALPPYWALPVKLFAAALVLLAAGLPILTTWEALAATAAVLALVFGDCRRGGWRLPAALAVVLAVVGIKAVLPRADLAEGHNAFLVVEADEPLEQGLPPEIFASWKSQFTALYPPTDAPPMPFSWRAVKTVPTTLYAASTDALWRQAKYSRQVDTIDFRSLAEFRGGFTSELNSYNFWGGDLARDSMPFYAMYELTPAAVGSRLRWTGQVFWERSHGTFDEIVHETIAERAIGPQDAGKRVYVAFFPMRDTRIGFHLVPSPWLRIAGWSDAAVSLLGMFLVVALLIRPRWPDYLRAVSICFVAYYVAIALFGLSSGRLGDQYYPHGGGSDGIVHESYGRTMAMLARRGELGEALKGVEDVYWFTPGMRYVRFVEKLLFGDTNLLFALLLSLVPIPVFQLIRRMVGALPAWLIVAAFCTLPLDNLSFRQYVQYAGAGYGEGIAIGAFVLGLVLLLHHQPGAVGRRAAYIWGGGAALAISMFIRPNFALAVVWVGCLHAWLSWRRRDLPAAAALAAGLALALWMPFHNWYYGGELYLISESGQTLTVPLGWRDYLSAAGDVVQGRAGTPATTATRAQLAGWLWSDGLSSEEASAALGWTARVARLLALAVTGWVAFWCVAARGVARVDLAFIAGAALCAHVPMLFIFSTDYRYAMLAWDLSMIVLIVWCLRGRAARVNADVAAVRLQPSTVR